MRRAPALLAVVLVLSACGPSGPAGEPAASPDRPSPAEPSPGSPVPSEEDTVSGPLQPTKPPPSGPARRLTGTLGGDAQLEGGCVWLEAEGRRYEVQFPHGWRTTVEPVRLRGPGGAVAEEGDTVTVEGLDAPDLLTTCQVGPVFRATRVLRPG